MKTNTYQIHARCLRSFTSWIEIEANTANEALAKARLEHSELVAAAKDGEDWSWDEFAVYRDDGTKLLYVLDGEARLREASPALLEALNDLLGDLRSVQGGVCQHCGREYEDFQSGDCPSDDCPSFQARAAIAKATVPAVSAKQD